MMIMLRIGRILQIIVMLVMSAIWLASIYAVDTLVELIVKYQMRTRICKKCREEFYE